MAKMQASRGDSAIPWPQWQRHDEAAEAYFRSKARGEAAFAPTGSGGSGVRVKVKNNSGADRRAGEVLQFTGFALDDEWLEQGYHWLTGGEPLLTNGCGVLTRATPSGDIDDCQVAGVCLALVNVGNANHTFCFVDKSNYVMQSGYGGANRILYKPSGTGEKKCLIALGDGFEVHRGVINNGGQITKGSSGTVDRYKPGTTTTSGISDTVTIDFATVANSKKLAYVGSGAGMYAIAAEC